MRPNNELARFFVYAKRQNALIVRWHLVCRIRRSDFHGRIADRANPFLQLQTALLQLVDLPLLTQQHVTQLL